MSSSVEPPDVCQVCGRLAEHFNDVDDRPFCDDCCPECNEDLTYQSTINLTGVTP